MRRSATRRFREEGRRLAGYSFADFVHGYVYARWPYLYIGLATGERSLPWVLRPLESLAAWWIDRSARRARIPRAHTFADRYHGKVVPTDAAEDLVTLDRPIELRGIEQVIPYTTARDIVLADPDHIAVLECPCRSVRQNPCLPLDVCLIVGEPFASLIVEHHPRKARWLSQEEAAEILRAERDRGHVHHAFFKDAMLDRFYAICNCCSCCCGAMQAWRSGTPMLASSGYVARVDAGACVGCGRCEDVCPFDAARLDRSTAEIDAARCMGCGVCVEACPHSALELDRDPSKSEPLRIRDLAQRVA